MDEEYGVSDSPLNNPYGIMAPAFPAAPKPTATVIPMMPPPPPIPMPRPAPFTLGPIGGAQGIGPMLPPGGTVVPFRATDPSFVKGAGKALKVGQDLPLERLVELQRKAESSGNYQAINKEKPGNTASGAYQYTDGTWNNYMGYPKAALAPKHIQDRRFAEDVARRVNKYQGDVFRTLADHYLPAFANKPHLWDSPQRIKVGRREVTVGPVAKYLRHVLKGTPYVDQIDAYIASHK